MTNNFKLSPEGRSYIDVHIKPFDKITLIDIPFKVDTGADLTTISKKELIRLGYSPEWLENNMVEDGERTISRAGGKAKGAFYVIIPKANILGRDLLNWPFYIRQENYLDFPNLLGINILTHFNFLFDYENWSFNIKSVTNPKKKLPMLSSQYIENLMTSNLFSGHK